MRYLQWFCVPLSALFCGLVLPLLFGGFLMSLGAVGAIALALVQSSLFVVGGTIAAPSHQKKTAAVLATAVVLLCLRETLFREDRSTLYKVAFITSATIGSVIGLYAAAFQRSSRSTPAF